MFDIELSTEVSELFVVKLSAVVGDDDPREAESTDDGLHTNSLVLASVI